ncbi:MAG TPA: carboxypeptidase-like regulatory domain-containing protein [Candidatus Acidoferrales bacterium]|nr:carboxypeptidase-like regulatory domain-containing protein [Candidatus Acidoferrales bacterium]
MKCAYLTLVLCAGAFGQAQPPAPPKGSIEGQVVNAKTGTPLKKAGIRLAPVPAPNPNPNPGAGPVQRPPIRSIDTDEQGRFSFAGLDSGKYRLSAERQGFLRQNYGERKYSGGGTPILVGDGQTVKGILLRMNPQAVITGKVLDEDGEPLARVQVRAMRYEYSGGRRQWDEVASADTSDIGEYRLADLKPGRYLVSTNPRNLARNIAYSPDEPLPQTPDVTYAATYYPSAADSVTAVPIDVGAGGEIRGLDVRLIKTRVWRIRGKVNGPGEARGRGAIQVGLTPAEGPQTPRITAVARQPGGDFEIRNVPPGSYILYSSSQTGGQAYAAAVPVQVGGSHVDGLVVNLATGGELEGIVKVVDATTPVAVPNLSVMLRPARAIGFGGGPPQRARVGDDLKFSIKGVPPVKFAVNVAGIPNTCYLKSVQFGGRDVTAEGLDMSAGGPLEIVISAAPAQIDTVVVDKDGKGVVNAVVAIVPKSGGNPIVQMTDENGILSVKGLKPGGYNLVAWEDVEQGAPQDPDFLQQFEKQMKSVKVDAAGHEAVQLTAIPADDR